MSSKKQNKKKDPGWSIDIVTFGCGHLKLATSLPLLTGNAANWTPALPAWTFPSSPASSERLPPPLLQRGLKDFKIKAQTLQPNPEVRGFCCMWWCIIRRRYLSRYYPLLYPLSGASSLQLRPVIFWHWAPLIGSLWLKRVMVASQQLLPFKQEKPAKCRMNFRSTNWKIHLFFFFLFRL